MKAFVVVTDTRRGGTPTRLASLARAARDRDWSVTVVSVLPEGEVATELASQGIPTISLQVSAFLDVPRAVRKLRRLLLEERPSVVQSALWHANLISRLATRRTGIPLVTGYQSVDEAKPRARIALDRLTVRADARTICVSRAVADVAIHRDGVDPDRVAVVPTGKPIPPSFAAGDRRDARSALGIPDDARVAGWVGRIHPVKRVPLLLRAVAALPGWWCVLVGDGEERPRIEQEAERLGLADRVVITGMREDVTRLLPALDVFCLTSRWEGSPGALVEAMAAGLPCVVVSFPGLDEIVKDGVDALVVGAEPEDVAGAIEAAAARPDLGPAAREAVAERFSLDAMVDGYLDVWREVVEESRERRL
jgi:glycosyltransferase involved in cell wall biosynthesis